MWALADVDPEWGNENKHTNVLLRRGITSETPQGVAWEAVDEHDEDADPAVPLRMMSQISAGPCGLVWAIDAQYGVWCRGGVSQSAPGGV